MPAGSRQRRNVRCPSNDSLPGPAAAGDAALLPRSDLPPGPDPAVNHTPARSQEEWLDRTLHSRWKPRRQPLSRCRAEPAADHT